MSLFHDELYRCILQEKEKEKEKEKKEKEEREREEREREDHKRHHRSHKKTKKHKRSPSPSVSICASSHTVSRVQEPGISSICGCIYMYNHLLSLCTWLTLHQ